MPYISKSVTQKQWIHGDFDKDRVPNIDDPKPLDSKVRRIPKSYLKSHPYQTSYDNSEVSLSKVLKDIERRNNEMGPRLRKFIEKNPGSYGRIKGVPSTMKKLYENYYDKLGDVAGATIVTKDRRWVYITEKNLHKKWRTDPELRNDYYKKPKKGVYYAIHNAVILGKGKKARVMELQIKSKGMERTQKSMHKYYKKGKIPRRYVGITRRQFLHGD